MTIADTESQTKLIRGRTIVLGLLIFGLLMSGSLYLFQAVNTFQFADTQNALAREFPDSRPRVEGGRLKGKQINPTTFRTTLAVPFNPNDDDVRIQKMADRILEIASENLNLNEYEQAELHFYQAVPEQKIILREIKRDIKTWLAQH
ncbi:MAG: hypothetical protein K0U86_16880 [Planctomycetes bacterium]|nr:hypothetical protein [Planctomycetota bacterium]MCH9726577.1 hypothetical protein [Planctomycetota bacterium]MCH9779246.1 hypothetical protein [Planctomycetota bacterium]MCH9791256.1 hypothetical protein [Planctomycetota bacterium]MDF1743165.1 hypothetical protein [Gimesia sp.]